MKTRDIEVNCMAGCNTATKTTKVLSVLTVISFAVGLAFAGVLDFVKNKKKK